MCIQRPHEIASSATRGGLICRHVARFFPLTPPRQHAKIKCYFNEFNLNKLILKEKKLEKI